MAHYSPLICEISTLHSVLKQRGDDHALVQLRRSSILRAESTRWSFPLADWSLWLLEGRRRAWLTQDHRLSEGTEGLFLQRQAGSRRIDCLHGQTWVLHAPRPLSRYFQR